MGNGDSGRGQQRPSVSEAMLSQGRTSQILAVIRRIGIPTAIILTTCVLSALSVSIASITHHITGDPIGYTGLINTAVIPFLLGVPTLIVLLSLLSQLERTREQLAHLSTYDTLTGCLNRRSLLERGQAAFDEACANQQTTVLALIDADNFKTINDNYGHQVGDATLRQLATSLQNSIPDKALLGRYGGEEFAVVLPSHSPAQGSAVAEALRRQVEQDCEYIEGHKLAATISVGLSISAQSGTDMSLLLAAADRALYDAKHQGRNRVCWSQNHH